MDARLFTLREEINRLDFTSNEQDSLRKYFTDGEKITIATTFLSDYTTDDGKRGYLKSLISMPGIGSLTSGIKELHLQVGATNVGGLITVIKLRLQIEKVITIRSGIKTLENDELVAELFNTKDNAYEIIIVENDDESSSNDEEVEKNASNIELTA
ncbi:hypothetical protein C1645_827415 [Glomus cerebriforme]|uniref:Uncharacterized protein n=1 Tax=Glomus cerebriforme TaxID=658196 RepID=A0A397SNK0_9GLOM|nr:hypothetical protein C1645_827415 [Glomus cerebriforme]